MEPDLLLSLRTAMTFGVIASALALQPEICFAAAKPFITLWRRVKLFRESIAARFRSGGKERFWQIDMTKFEP